MNEFMISYLLRQFGIYIAIVGFIYSFVFTIPLIQALYAYDKKKWLQRQFDKVKSNNEESENLKAMLLQASEPGQAYPIYKLFKFYFAVLGITAVVSGLLIMVIPEDISKDAIDFLLFLPLIFGLLIYALYAALFKGQGLWKEIAAVFLYIGLFSTTFMAYVNFEINEWLRMDILSFILLTIGLFLIKHLESTFLSYLYIILVTASASVVNFSIDLNWMYFLPKLLWFFGLGILFFWVPQLRAAKDIGAKETIFGILFTVMILSLTTSQLSASDLMMPSLAVVLPALYVFSKAYYKKADNFLGKPVELFVVLIIIIMAVMLSMQSVMASTSDSIYLFKNYSFHKQVSYFILAGLIGWIFYMINHDFNESEEDINPMVITFPLIAFLITYIIGDYGGHYLMTIFLLVLGYKYVKNGIESKDSLLVFLGAVIFVNTLVVKVTDVLKDQLQDSKFLSGLLVFLFGVLFLSVVFYVRSRWTVTDPSKNKA